MGELVCDGTEFSCPFCSSKLKLTVFSSSSKGDGKLLANMGNCIVPPPGGQCTMIPSAPCPCTAGAKPISPGQSPVSIDGMPALGAGAKCMCPKGPVLSVASPGQKKVFHETASVASLAAIAGAVADNLPDKKKEEEEDQKKEEKKDESLQKDVDNTIASIQKGEIKNSRAVEDHKLDLVKKGPYKGEKSRPYIDSPYLKTEIMQSTKPIREGSGALRWASSGKFRGSKGDWELVIDPKSKKVYHFNFVS